MAKQGGRITTEIFLMLATIIIANAINNLILYKNVRLVSRTSVGFEHTLEGTVHRNCSSVKYGADGIQTGARYSFY